MQIHLVDGTYELFRHFHSPGGRHRAVGPAGDREVGAARGVLRTAIGLLRDGATHIGIATDHVIESFRNELWPGYKTGEGIDPDLFGQFSLVEEVLEAAGFTVWPMVEWEADDALGSAAAVAAADPRVERVVICTPDKDLGQCCVNPRVVQFDRRAGQFRDAEGVREKYGVPPASIPDWLALVGDSADGFPGLPGWGAKTAAAVLTRYGRIEDIPLAAGQWDVPGVRGASRLAAALTEGMELALLFRRLATLVTDVPVGTVDEWRWTGPTDAWERAARSIDAEDSIKALARLGHRPRP